MPISQAMEANLEEHGCQVMCPKEQNSSHWSFVLPNDVVNTQAQRYLAPIPIKWERKLGDVPAERLLLAFFLLSF